MKFYRLNAALDDAVGSMNCHFSHIFRKTWRPLPKISDSNVSRLRRRAVAVVCKPAVNRKVRPLSRGMRSFHHHHIFV